MTSQREEYIDQIIEQAKHGEGVLKKAFAKAREEYRIEEMSGNINRANQMSLAEADTYAKAYMEGEYAEQVKAVLMKANSGEEPPKSQVDAMKGMMDNANAAQQAASGLMSGSIWGMVGAIGPILNNFAEYITAFFAYMFPGDDKENAPKSFSEALANIRSERLIKDLGKDFGVSGDELFNAIDKGPKLRERTAMSASVTDTQPPAEGAETPALGAENETSQPSAETPSTAPQGTNDVTPPPLTGPANMLELDKGFNQAKLDEFLKADKEKVQKAIEAGHLKVDPEGKKASEATTEVISMLDELTKAPPATPNPPSMIDQGRTGDSWDSRR